jgi:hypothetical protein
MATRHEKIFIACCQDNFGMDKIETMLPEMNNLRDQTSIEDCATIRQLPGKYVEYILPDKIDSHSSAKCLIHLCVSRLT